MPTSTTQLALCPNCTSAFSITQEQLEAALGAVRCGQCKKIFNAKFNLVTLEELQATDEVQATPLAKEIAESTDNLEETATESLLAIDEPLETLDLAETDLTPAEQEHFDQVDNHLDSWLEAETEFCSSIASNTADLADESNLEEDDFLSELIPDNLTSDLLEPQEKTMAKKKKSLLLPVALISLMLALALGIGGALWFINSSSQGDFKISKVSVNPTASQLQLRVEFKITNTSNSTQLLPPLEVHLLNLSNKTITKHPATSSSLGAPSSSLQAGQSFDLSLTVERPNTLVKSAKVKLYKAN